MNEDPQDVQEKAAQENASQNKPKIMGADTAFLVFVQNGTAHAVNDLGIAEIRIDDEVIQVEPMRRATADDLYRYCAEIMKDVQIGQTIEKILTEQIRLSQAMQQKAQGGKGGLHVPGRS